MAIKESLINCLPHRRLNQLHAPVFSQSP